MVIAFIQTKLIATRAACIYCELLHNGMETKCMHLEYMYSNCADLQVTLITVSSVQDVYAFILSNMF